MNPPSRTGDPPMVRARACAAAVRKKSPGDFRVAFNPANAAFAIEASRLWAWRALEVSGTGGTVTTIYGGSRYVLAAPAAGQATGAALAIRIDRPHGRPLALIAWRGDETCLHRFSLHELGDSGRVTDVATNCYDCDP